MRKDVNGEVHLKSPNGRTVTLQRKSPISPDSSEGRKPARIQINATETAMLQASEFKLAANLLFSVLLVVNMTNTYFNV